MGVPRSKHRPLRSGVAIRTALPSGGVATDSFIGTLTGFATLNSDGVTKVLVSNQHVLAGVDISEYPNGDTIRRYRESPNRDRYIFQYEYTNAEEVGTRPITYGQMDSSEVDNVDIGMCRFEESGDLKGAYTLHDGDGHGSSHTDRKIVRGVVEPAEGMDDLIMLSARSGEVGVEVDEIGMPRSVNQLTFSNCVTLTVKDGATILKGGNSGSGVFKRNDDGTFQIVCVVFASDPLSSDATMTNTLYAHPASLCQTELGITFGKPLPLAVASVAGPVKNGKVRVAVSYPGVPNTITLDASMSEIRD